MAELIWAVLCDRTYRDERTNNMALTVLEQIVLPPDAPTTIEGDPELLPLENRMVTFWHSTDVNATVSARIILTNPAGRGTAMAPDLKVEFGGKHRVRAVFVADGFPYSGIGTYWFELQQLEADAWRTVARVPFEVALAQTAQL
jgi:hypothetical protein